jgi:hypothetical protein
MTPGSGPPRPESSKRVSREPLSQEWLSSFSPFPLVAFANIAGTLAGTSALEWCIIVSDQPHLKNWENLQ